MTVALTALTTQTGRQPLSTQWQLISAGIYVPQSATALLLSNAALGDTAALADANGNLSTTSGTKYDPYNDSLAAILALGYPTQQRSATPASTTVTVPLAPAVNVTGSPVPLASSLGVAGLPGLAPVKWLRLTVSNNATLQPITGLSIAFTDSVDGVTDTVTITYPFSISLASGSKARYWFPIPEHYSLYPSATLTVTFNASSSAGYVQTQCVWGFTPITSYPAEWQWTFAKAITDNTSDSLLAAPVAGVRTCIEELMVVNSSTTTGATYIFQAGSGGTTFLEGYAQFNGLGFKFGPYTWQDAYRMATATALFGQAGAAASTVYVSGKGHYEPN